MNDSERSTQKKLGTRGPRPGQGGRPKKLEFDLQAFETLVKLPMKAETVAQALGVDRKTLDRFALHHYKKTFAKVQEEHRGMFVRNILGKQYQVAMNGNVKMLTWLGQNYCDQSSKVETKNETEIEVQGEIKYVTSWGGLAEPSDEN